MISPLAGKPAPASLLLDVPALLAAYVDLRPDPGVPTQRVAFGTSGHRGTSLERSFNEWHVVAMTQAICEYRRGKGILGPMFLAIDTHALSRPAFETALEVLAGNGVTTFVDRDGDYTPTPALSQAIISFNLGRSRGFADGIVITPSHNPPEFGGFKYNPPHGGPADTEITGWIEQRANELLAEGLKGINRMPFEQARKAISTYEYDFRGNYIDDLASVIDFDVIRGAGVRMGVDPLGGAGVTYWDSIAALYKIDLKVISEKVDPQFAFMSVDWDGKIRMDPSSPYAMQGLIGLKDQFDVAFACDTDHDRHGIVTASSGLLPANHYLSAMVDYLFQNRAGWRAETAVGKTLVSTALIDRIAAKLGRRLFEAPVGFKWFVEGLRDGSLGFGGEESAGATFLRKDGTTWTTDKDGIAAALLAGEITARSGKDPGEYYRTLAAELGEPLSSRVDAVATPAQKARLAKLSPEQLGSTELAGEPIEQVLNRAPANDAAIGGIKVVAANGWFAARPSGTEDIYKIYGESFKGKEHLELILAQAQQIVDKALASS
jgi:phosphoglucomutase